MLDFRHLYYFWVFTKESRFARAAERLYMAVQIIGTGAQQATKMRLGFQSRRPVAQRPHQLQNLQMGPTLFKHHRICRLMPWLAGLG